MQNRLLVSKRQGSVHTKRLFTQGEELFL